MLKMNKTIALILALSSSTAFANSISISALYINPSFGGNGLGYSSFGNYAGADNQQVIRTTNGNNRIYNIQPDRDWGFQVGGEYDFSQNNSLMLDWYHLSESVNGHLPTPSLFSGSVDGFYAGDLELSTKWDAVNLEFGHTIKFLNTETIKPHAGLGYVRIKNTFTNHPKLFLNSSPYMTTTDNISFMGIGPRVGVDFNHSFGYGFNAYLKTATSLFIGNARQAINGYVNVVNEIYGVIPYGTNNFVSSENNILVPELEAKLGVSYEYQFSRGSLGLDLGYMWVTYMRSMVTYTGIGIVGSSLGTPTTTHFDLNGGYFTVSWNC